MLAKRRLLTLVLIGSAIASAACSLITDVDRSKIEGSGGSEMGGSSSLDAGTDTGGSKATGGGTNRGTGGSSASDDAGDAS
jgi:hypothetical protein